ncbi:MAG TPA: hypothetical protein VNU94_00045, partial [Acidobacteriaceae bacterium]|nr:hypothetical protein [Acidobacteriaceae bacterium]
MMKRTAGSMNRLRVCVAAGFSFAVMLLAGCGLGAPAAPVDVSNMTVSGIVHGGQQAVGASNVALFATTSSGTSNAGYGGNLVPIGNATTSSSATGGTFTIASTGTCPAGQQAYLVATGGDPGIGSGTDNSAIFLVAALGPCSGGLSGMTVDINEVTTVAAAYALSGFAPAGGSGMTEAAVETAVSGSSAMPGVTTSTANTQGLTDAFLNASNIVNSSTGTANATTSTGTVPVSTINALADILQDCVNSASPSSGTHCSSLFTAATPPGGTAPVNVFQAALDIAQNPGNNVNALFGLISPQAAFPTSVTAAPNDWTVGVTYNSSKIASAGGMGINSLDDVYISGTGSMYEFGPQGALLSASNLVSGTVKPASADNLRRITFDPSGNLFVSDGAQAGVYEYNTGGTWVFLNYDVAPASNADANNYGIGVDQDGDVWTTSYKASTCTASGSKICTLVEFPSTATTTPAYAAYAPVQVFPTTSGGTPSISAPFPASAAGLGGARDVVFDVKTSTVWMPTLGDAIVEALPVTVGTSGVALAAHAPYVESSVGNAPTSGNTGGCGTIALAVDSSTSTVSKAYVVATGGTSAVCGVTTAPEIVPVTLTLPSTYSLGTPITGGGLSTPASIVIDGNNNLFVANEGASTIVEANTTSTTPVSPNSGLYLTNYSQQATATATEVGGVVQNTVVVTSGGSGYGGLTPTVTITGGGGTGATATATVQNGSVSAVTITAGGTGYTSNPTLTLSAPVATATATATEAGGAVTGFTIVSGGAGYAGVAPTVTISAPTSGTTATATATVTNGIVSAI